MSLAVELAWEADVFPFRYLSREDLKGMGNSNNDPDGKDLMNWGEFFSLFKKNCFAILFCSIILAVVAFLYTSFCITQMYLSSAMVYVYTEPDEKVSYSDVQLNSQLTADYEIIATSRLILEQVNENLGMNYTYEELQDIVTVENPLDTRVIKVSVVHSDPQRASDIANEIVNVLGDQTTQVIDSNTLVSLGKAVPATSPYTPSKAKNTLAGFIAGFLISSGVILIYHYCKKH